MKTSTTLWVVGVVIVIGFVSWGLTRLTNKGVDGQSWTNATSTVGTSTTDGTNTKTNSKPGGVANSSSGALESYTNATHNFTISYPRELNAESFGNFHLLNQNDWRVNATQAKRGTPIISIPIVRIDNQAKNLKNYPLYYAAEVRVGVSTDVAQCYSIDDGYSSQPATNVTINGVIWKRFSFGGAAMMQYIKGESYRTVRNNKCYVVEQIENGSNYRDETLVGGYTDADLKAFYAKTTPIVMSFKFTK